ncbi:transcription initiation factor IIA large subunit [Aspergillus homomorphus CBS 101889]|uniref:Transcription factor IIA, alpha/beta subunit n=1 Tax=Aspergillus homomorphus (strain CBS 101889) TaxID=1450537 RepID=A0A395IA43_ASPHC|nr:transcription factor IIA, alpha/beta subunit [Aspergillus homomorphus CBS 101889]RAL16669.1 transcription factor IIA, alpha/beta subunit [Aspergillus homomorphus CBS 101889]
MTDTRPQGAVFDRVIQEVCDGSQVDFEESGVDQQTLLDLRKSWQKKLSSLGVAHFPWDPPPPQQAPPSQTQQHILPPTATVPSNAPRPAPSPHPPHPQQPQQHAPPPPPPQQQQPIPQSMPTTAPPMQAPAPVGAPSMGHLPHIKTEPGLNQPGMMSLNNNNNMMPPSGSTPQSAQSAQQRAAEMLRQRYGAAAANSVSQLQAQSQASMGMPGQQRPPNMQHLPNGQAPQPQIKQEPGYPPAPRPSLGNAQTDGACDAGDALSEWKAEVARRREAAQRQNGEGDRVLREHLKQRMLQLEGGGLMIPLAERQTSSAPGLAFNATNAIGVPPSAVPRAQYDGPGGDDERDEDDEDAINSDLDDPDDLVADEHDGDYAMGQVMLCTYDKVQRVKNKWKCTLKDGILTSGGKEYVFHKGQGEFEW